MSERDTFNEFLKRIRAGDEQAAAELVRQYEPFIRREVRLHLADRALRRAFDSMDVCQSVLASFFVRAAAGQFDPQHPGQLGKLLVAMARNKLISAVRRQRRQRRDHRRVEAATPEELGEVVSAEASPSKRLAGKELLERLWQHLDDEERQMAELRCQGLAWPEIADRLGGKAQARRVQLTRALDRAAQDLGLEEGADE